MQGRRVDSPRAHTERQPIVVQRNETSSSSQSAQSTLSLLSGESKVKQEPTDVVRTRLPPRSRNGCWTCRTRKVKCDEQRPTCGQCARLNHMCDYSPRLDFKDDTGRVQGRMHDVQTEGSLVWHGKGRMFPGYGTNKIDDHLPPFVALTSDEDREEKASLKCAGTYIVVVTPDSFKGLPSYSTFSPTTPTGLANFSDNLNISDSDVKQEDYAAIEITDDPNIVILKSFEEFPRRASIQGATDPTLTNSNGSPGSLLEPFHYSPRRTAERNHERDAQLLHHYRANISAHLIKAGNGDLEEDIFEVQAHTFPPLFHAILAISALSQANRYGIVSTDAMEHYGMVLSGLRQADVQSLSSDGALFTHYLLLFYEIGHQGPNEADMRQQHYSALLRIISERFHRTGILPHTFIIWMTCLVDTYALLGGSGDGGFINTLVSRGMLPSPSACIPELDPNFPELRNFPDENPFFPAVLDLNQRVVLLAAHIGSVSRSIRAEEMRRRVSSPGMAGFEYSYFTERLTRVRGVQELCRNESRDWSQMFPQYWPYLMDVLQFPPRVQRLLLHAQSLYRACVIYAHTSMYAGQMSEPTPEFHSEVPSRITEILEIGTHLVQAKRPELQNLTFSLFIAGYAATSLYQKNMVIDLMTAFEASPIGGTTVMAKTVLERIYYKQQARIETTGYDFGVDWIAEFETIGKGLVMFGL